MNNFQLTKLLRNQVRRYRIAATELLLNELPKEHRSRAIVILRTNAEFQVFDDITGTVCVCQRCKRIPSSTAVARCVAAQAFCRASQSNRTLLTKNEVTRFFPTLFRHGLPAGYYVDTSTKTPRLGLLRVDIHLSPVSRIWQRSLDIIEKHRQQSEFRKLILADQFEITWLVVTESKANAIRHLVGKQLRELPVDAQSVPSLLNQLTPL
ncbi:hypothetical protein [Planctomycetes bacterium TBK1r]|uniref:Uncharacterized protein n=1 Tax=Stieleria magnilauensis TaxID=2527963 RepID=A0ABX5XVK1_9BACT|nr:hypothetical protein TBK1r_44260 [Planctomycetes bacterium TBK1r]